MYSQMKSINVRNLRIKKLLFLMRSYYFTPFSDNLRDFICASHHFPFQLTGGGNLPYVLLKIISILIILLIQSFDEFDFMEVL